MTHAIAKMLPDGMGHIMHNRIPSSATPTRKNPSKSGTVSALNL
jgi:hypothetical protein